MVIMAVDYALVIHGLATICVAGSLIYTVRTNGKKERVKDTELKTELTGKIENVTKKLDDPNDGLGAIKKAVEEQKVHCAKVSSTIAEQAKANRRDIDKLQRERRG